MLWPVPNLLIGNANVRETPFRQPRRRPWLPGGNRVSKTSPFPIRRLGTRKKRKCFSFTEWSIPQSYPSLVCGLRRRGSFCAGEGSWGSPPANLTTKPKPSLLHLKPTPNDSNACKNSPRIWALTSSLPLRVLGKLFRRFKNRCNMRARHGNLGNLDSNMIFRIDRIITSRDCERRFAWKFWPKSHLWYSVHCLHAA